MLECNRYGLQDIKNAYLKAWQNNPHIGLREWLDDNAGRIVYEEAEEER